MMTNTNLQTQVLLPEVRLSYPYVFEPRAQLSGKEKYFLFLLIDKGNIEMIEIIKRASQNTAQAGRNKFGVKCLIFLNFVLRFEMATVELPQPIMATTL